MEHSTPRISRAIVPMDDLGIALSAPDCINDF